ncbi:MAG: leucine--tRNA ligase [Nanoarchaeota archaeon]|nr:leucine--tRNA ligase [Nanoarchaeota archaeon]
MVDQLAIEKKWQAFWKENKSFVPFADESKEKYFGTVPYPYANSILHIGHGRMNTAADIMIRYQRLKGKNVLFPMAFHISGTPVLAVSDAIARGDEKQISSSQDSVGEYIKDPDQVKKIVSEFGDPNKVAQFYSSTMEETFNSVGLSIDWSKEFSTGDEGYKRFVTWQYKKLEEAGVLVQGKYPILYSYQDQNAVGEDDVKDGDIDKVTIQEMTYILFKDKDADEYFCVATLRPDALFGTTNLWIDPTHTIIKAKVDGQTWLVNKGSFEKISHQFDDVKIISEHQGEEFLEHRYITPLIDREIPVAAANFIDEKHGTGLVYSSPAGSPHDYLGLQEAKQEGRISAEVEVVNTVITKDKKGQVIEWEGSCPADAITKKYGITSSTDPRLEDVKQELYKLEHYGGTLNDNCGQWAGIEIKHAKEKIFDALVEAKRGGTLYETSRRAVTRADHEVIVANLQGQWFLDYSADESKKKAHAVLEQMSFLPKQLRATQAGYLDWVQKRPCARRRGIGTPLPQDPEWIVEPLSDSTIYQIYYPLAQFINEGKLSPEDLTLEFFDALFLGKGTSNHPHFKELKEISKYWKGIDLRYTAATHMSNHLSFLIYHYALILPELYHPHNITIGGLLIKDGEKISKSKGNGIPLVHVREKYGSDLYRLYIAVGTSFDAELDFRDDDIHQLRKKFDRWKEIMFATKQVKAKSYEEYSAEDKWLISKFYSRAKDYFAAMEEVGFREGYIAVLYEFLNDILYHLRRTNEQQTYQALRFIFLDYVKLMTPAIPHVCEELYQGEAQGIASLSIFDTDLDQYANKEIEDTEAMTQEILRTVAYHKDKRQISSLKKIIVVQAANDRFKLFDRLKEILSETNEFKKILPLLLGEFNDKQFITKFVPKTLGSGLQPYLSKEQEATYLTSVLSFIEKEFNCPVELKDADTFEIKQQALPGTPAVLVE